MAAIRWLRGRGTCENAETPPFFASPSIHHHVVISDQWKGRKITLLPLIDWFFPFYSYSLWLLTFVFFFPSFLRFQASSWDSMVYEIVFYGWYSFVKFRGFNHFVCDGSIIFRVLRIYDLYGFIEGENIIQIPMSRILVTFNLVVV